VEHSFNPARFFSKKLGIPRGDTIDAIVEDYDYLTTGLPMSERYGGIEATVKILSQFGYSINSDVASVILAEVGHPLDTYGDPRLLDSMREDGSKKMNSDLFIELSEKNIYRKSGEVLGHYQGVLEEDESPPCDTYPLYPFPCSKHILKFKNGKDNSVHYLPPFNPETNTLEEDYIQVYTVNDKYYVHHSTGLVIDSKHKGGRRRTVRRSSRRSKRSV
jgi:hypothetical protein